MGRFFRLAALLAVLPSLASAQEIGEGELWMHEHVMEWYRAFENDRNASYFAVGNLMGLSPLAEQIDPNSRTISVEDATDFPERGYLKIGRELVLYRAKEGNQLTGIERGYLASKPEHGPALQHKAGEPVVNYAAWAIAYYKVMRHPGEFTEFVISLPRRNR